MKTIKKNFDIFRAARAFICLLAACICSYIIIAYAGGVVNGNTITYTTKNSLPKRGTYYCVYLLTDGASIKCFKNMSTQAPTATLGGKSNKKYLSTAIVANQNNTVTGLADSVRFTYSIDSSGNFSGTVTIVNPSAKITGVAFVVRDSTSHYYSINDTADIRAYVSEALKPKEESKAETEKETIKETEKETVKETEKETEKETVKKSEETISEKELGEIKDSIGEVTKKDRNKGTGDTLPECVLKRVLRKISS